MSQTNENVKTEVTKLLVESLNDLIEGARGDLQNYAQQIVSDSVDAAAAGDTETLKQLEGQGTALLEVNRIRAVAGAERTVTRLISLAIGIALRFVVPIPLPPGVV